MRSDGTRMLMMILKERINILISILDQLLIEVEVVMILKSDKLL